MERAYLVMTRLAPKGFIYKGNLPRRGQNPAFNGFTLVDLSCLNMILLLSFQGVLKLYE